MPRSIIYAQMPFVFVIACGTCSQVRAEYLGAGSIHRNRAVFGDIDFLSVLHII